MVRVYSKAEYNIYASEDSYIIHNTRKEFSEGHTHVKNFKTCKFLIDLAIHKSIPHHLCSRFLISLSRITMDKNYSDKLLSLNETKVDKKRKNNGYYNKKFK